MFVTALFTIARIWKELTNRGVDKEDMVYIYIHIHTHTYTNEILLSHKRNNASVATWIDLEIILG